MRCGEGGLGACSGFLFSQGLRRLCPRATARQTGVLAASSLLQRAVFVLCSDCLFPGRLPLVFSQSKLVSKRINMHGRERMYTKAPQINGKASYILPVGYMEEGLVWCRSRQFLGNPPQTHCGRSGHRGGKSCSKRHSRGLAPDALLPQRCSFSSLLALTTPLPGAAGPPPAIVFGRSYPHSKLVTFLKSGLSRACLHEVRCPPRPVFLGNREETGSWCPVSSPCTHYIVCLSHSLPRFDSFFSLSVWTRGCLDQESSLFSYLSP